MSIVVPADVELFLTKYLRQTLLMNNLTVQVSNKEPGNLRLPLQRPLVVVRDDGGGQQSRLTFAHRVGVNVLAGSKRSDYDANRLARIVYGILTDDDIVEADASPIVAFYREGCVPPTPVLESLDVARRYMTVEYLTVGEF
ncbi:hypothetical protein HHJ78_10855 [Mobiluncus mulieris]|uniref:Tail terminator n=1 Tax=Mobiluncus mulieris TaxID=2052 RepID=A0A7Y0U3W8_9ACTO|nr:hypothetical protein [Mobiluncus mulieris]NMW65983.1 hypothetical protein [Mobiluncus mulieris]